ncbi:NAD(P)H-dependent glycerol-3-phosphate dehydrogenase [Aliiroseovarius subalbicans]|uniref:NAD(P)H-dependent glycerol-3-phosphate dehydrogenase n=1 Tax=Aliiroseovarius subalbicans TaxID=2925840 RepID=UPI001F5AF2C2|nr:NAD(P)H-dependent glycerol-3-phosphate dehydrogenase [Aliiroseovarius subalbicans]MCI2400013.1 NAD(P)-dependent glycerol-3-phosphate dehydrogenase [Aliiroseovarius subalbicans]
MSISVLGAGAFGTALAISLARDGRPVTLWARDLSGMDGENTRRLPGHAFPPTLKVTDNLVTASQAETLLIATPMQQLAPFLEANKTLFARKTLVACCKGVDLSSGRGPAEIIAQTCPSATPAILSGPSFAVDIAAGLPTALTLAADDGVALQQELSTANLRLYRSSDLIGVELGGALKNVVAIACGIAIAAGLGESARAALMTRGYAEMQRFAAMKGAQPETLAGLSGFGDLALTCTSEKSRNYAFGLALGRGQTPAENTTVEGKATAKAVSQTARNAEIDMPIADMVVAVLDQHITIREAAEMLLSRPLKEE